MVTRTATAITLRQAGWLLGLLSTALVLSGVGDDTLRYERTAVLNGEYWRLLTGHFVHGSVSHLLLNLAGLGLVAALFPRDYSFLEWLFIGFCSIVAIDLAFVCCEPQLHWYVGFSGVLHGALAAGAVAWLRHETKAIALLLCIVLIGKLLWEQLRGALPFSGDMPVIVDAHLYGAMGGTLAAVAIWVCKRDWPSLRRSL